MNKTLTATLAAAAIAVVVTSTSALAQHRHHHHHRGHHHHGGVGAGLAAGIVGGLIVGSAIANSRPAYVVEPAPVYVAPTRYCIVDQQVWSNRYQAWVVRPTRVHC
jgi:hypothetical protein